MTKAPRTWEFMKIYKRRLPLDAFKHFISSSKGKIINGQLGQHKKYVKTEIKQVIVLETYNQVTKNII